VFSTMLLLWNIAFSPYGFSGRLFASFGIALCLVGLRLVRVDGVDDPPARLTRGASRYQQPRSGGPADGRGTVRNLRQAPAAASQRISVVVPNYNSAPFLCQGLESVLGQASRPHQRLVQGERFSDGSYRHTPTGSPGDLIRLATRW
jgi:hypothetical protein